MNDNSSASRTDLEPIGLMIGSLIRRSPIVLLCAGLVAAATWFGLGVLEDPVADRTATSRVGVTTEVVWPFYDVVLEQGRVMVDDPGFRSDLEADLGFPIESIDTSIPDLLSVFDIEIVAGDGEQAAQAADRAAQMVIERGADKQAADVTEGIAALDKQIEEIETRIAERRASVDAANARIDEIAAAQAVDYDEVLEEERWQLSLQRDIDQAVLVDSERDRNGLLNQRSALVNGVQPDSQYEVLRTADDPSDDSSARLPLTLAAAFVALILASAGVIVADRRRGDVRHPWQLRNVCGVDEVHVLTPRSGGYDGLESLVDQLHLASKRGERLVGLVDVTEHGLDQQQFLRQFSEHGLSVGVASVPNAVAGADISFLDVSREYSSVDAPRVWSRACDTLLILTSRRTSVEHAREVVERAETSPGVVAVAMVDAR